MAAGVPVVANTAGALPELLADERGWLVPYRYWYYDPFGNQRRYDISVEDAVRTLLEVKDNKAEVERRVNRAREYVEGRTWDKAARQVLEAIEHFG
jgi:glycosyltransferase involved in cell wall biosynthesis